MISQIIICVYVLHKNRNGFKDPAFIEKQGAYMKSVRARGYLYEPVMMVIKLLFVLIPLCLPDQGNKIQILLLVQSLFIIWYGNSEPHESRAEYRITMFNQAMLMLIYYHLLVFSDFVFDPSTKFKMGYTLLGFIGILISINLSVSMRNQVIKLQRKRLLK